MGLVNPAVTLAHLDYQFVKLLFQPIPKLFPFFQLNWRWFIVGRMNVAQAVDQLLWTAMQEPRNRFYLNLESVIFQCQSI